MIVCIWTLLQTRASICISLGPSYSKAW